MATSSIFSSVKIKDAEIAEALIDALDESSKGFKRNTNPPDIEPITDKTEIRAFMSTRFPDL